VSTLNDGPGALRVGFVVENILGHASHARNLAQFVSLVPGIAADLRPLSFEPTGLGRRLPVYRSNWSLRSGIQSRRAISSMRRQAPLDGLFIHTQVPALISADSWRRIPTVISVDATPRQIDELGTQYDHRVRGGVLERLKHGANATVFRRAVRVVAWSSWARSGLERDYGVPEEKVAVIPPGVDLEAWRPGSWSRERSAGTVRTLFVGGDFERKGGRSLLDAARRLRAEPGAPRIELHLVTRSAVVDEPGVVVHRGLSAGDPALIELYRSADIFCLPSTGDCLPIALAEAGAAGLPLVSTPVGAIPEIVRPGVTGELVRPGDTAELAAVLRRLASDTEYRLALGRGAAAVARAEHDARRNAQAVVDVIAQVIKERA
jgi:glycosyltransferase involved in cell wall biosynthesis